MQVLMLAVIAAYSGVLGMLGKLVLNQLGDWEE